MDDNLYKDVYKELNKIYNKLKSKAANGETQKTNESKTNQINIMTLIGYIKNLIDSAILNLAEKKANDYINDGNKKNEIFECEPLMQKYEAQIREHIKMEQELKLIAETFQEQNEELENEVAKYKGKLQLQSEHVDDSNLKNEINSLKKLNKTYKEQIDQHNLNEKKLKTQLGLKEKEIIIIETKHKEEIKNLKLRISNLEKLHSSEPKLDTQRKNSSGTKLNIHRKITDLQTINAYGNYKKLPPTLNNLNTTDKNGYNNKLNNSHKKLNSSAMKNNSIKSIRSISANRTSASTGSKKIIRNTSGNKQPINSNSNYSKYCYSMVTKGNEHNKEEKNKKFNIFFKDFLNEMDQKRNKKAHARNKSTGEIIGIKRGNPISKDPSKNSLQSINMKLAKFRDKKFSTIEKNETNCNRSALDIASSSNYSNTIKQEIYSYHSKQQMPKKKAKKVGKNMLLNRSAKNLGEDYFLKSSNSRIESLKK